MKKYIVYILPIVLGVGFMQCMERPPHAPKHPLEDQVAQPDGKRSKADRVVVMPECNEETHESHRALLEAAAQGDLEYVRQHLPAYYFNDEHISHPYAKYFGYSYFVCSDIKGRCLMCFAVLNHHAEMFEFLLPRLPFEEIEINKELLTALKRSDEKIATLFINCLFRDSSESCKKLFVALLLDREKEIQELLNADAHFVDESEDQLYGPLHAAVLLRSTIGIRLLAGRGCKINSVNSAKYTPLSLAVALGDVDIIRELLKAGADAKGRMPNGIPLVYRATYDGDEEILRTLLESGADANSKDDDEYEALLHVAAMHANVACIRILLERGASVDVRDRLGYTPLHLASKELSAESVKLLLRSGADENACVTSGVDKGKTALGLALDAIAQRVGIEQNFENHDIKKEIEVVRRLLLWGAEIRDDQRALLKKMSISGFL